MNLHEPNAQSADGPKDWPPESQQHATQQLQEAMGSLRGHAEYASLGQIHQVAVDRFGFAYSMEDTLNMLAKLLNVCVENEDPIENSRVYAPSYWNP